MEKTCVWITGINIVKVSILLCSDNLQNQCGACWKVSGIIHKNGNRVIKFGITQDPQEPKQCYKESRAETSHSLASPCTSGHDSHGGMAWRETDTQAYGMEQSTRKNPALSQPEAFWPRLGTHAQERVKDSVSGAGQWSLHMQKDGSRPLPPIT